ncbi:MBL fold metallo-hydrolase RNA specificity domain-containing protein [Marinobacterium arenosum]|uniref:MBL fold metallo-hydrolase RNA specificity domain-containing protein n=1 Tax=Marinobacterium arenosum TaxID=2862496 RepID=UPI001C93D086|nr:MBL fold metallo-hydrolase [Marinobacterium arenosum]MBY4679057.1 MBL fold metallo-hydrolase [Marinobacterium arenosum]
MSGHTYPFIQHHGGAEGVTGSCHQLHLSTTASLMVDCGLFQGQEAERLGPADQQLDQLAFEPRQLETLQALIISHVHIDHVGRLPWLLAAGFRGPIYCSIPSAQLLPLVMEEALEMGFTRNRRMIRQFLRQLDKQLRPLEYLQWQTINADCSIKLHRAGHILGSAYLSIQAGDQTIVFSGDLGAPWAPLLPAPSSPWRADWLILESTYGDRLHSQRRSRRKQLEKTLLEAQRRQGTLMIPAFSLGRSQELLYELERIIHRHRQQGGPLAQLEVVIDSPLAQRFTDIYRQLQPYWDAEAHRSLRQGRKPLAFENLTCISDHREHLQTVDYLRRKPRSCVLISASGMCSGGRIVNYLKALLPDPRHQVLFVGYQTAGTPGRDIQRYGPSGGWVRLEGEKVEIRAAISSISGYSAHADQAGLLAFIRRMRHKPQRVRLVHGDPTAKQALMREIQKEWPEIRVELATLTDRQRRTA